MSTPHLTENDAVQGRHPPDAAPNIQPAIPLAHKPDYSAYIEKARVWNDDLLQPWRISVLVQNNKVHAVLERKELQFDLLDWFEDARVGAVMRGEKIVSPSEFWFQLYRQSVSAIQQHFGNLPLQIGETIPAGNVNVFFGEKTNKPQAKPQPSPIAGKSPRQKKKFFKPRS